MTRNKICNSYGAIAWDWHSDYSREPWHIYTKNNNIILISKHHHLPYENTTSGTMNTMSSRRGLTSRSLHRPRQPGYEMIPIEDLFGESPRWTPFDSRRTVGHLQSFMGHRELHSILSIRWNQIRFFKYSKWSVGSDSRVEYLIMRFEWYTGLTLMSLSAFVMGWQLFDWNGHEIRREEAVFELMDS